MSNRQDVALTPFAQDAETAIPANPIPGASYRDENFTGTGGGWAYSQTVESQDFNQTLYVTTLLMQMINNQGTLEYSDKVDYYASVGAIVLDDGVLYKCCIGNGPSSTTIKPSTDTTGAWRPIGSTETQVITSSTTYTPTPGAVAIEVTLVGAGGGAGGVDGQGPGTAANSIGGAGGGATVRVIPLDDIAPSYSVVVGAGGVGGLASVSGAPGGQSSFTGGSVNMVANGGSGGAGLLATGNNQIELGVLGGTSTGGQLNIKGDDSTSSSVVAGGVRTTASSSGGSIFGGSTGAVFGNGGGAQTKGAGGGACTVPTPNTINYKGGNGADGVCIIKEFF